ncbi:12214_t:CDS:2 [Dentiscutata erythropus]|uniref:12214_t:CDS:1 n=1 Tax=Dentiscutata erythropus TaxID=1348616 RepID=A0A9N9F7D5_9GLOM|nr:12214_t:CDS:2 [Dentiscutata erythropus]
MGVPSPSDANLACTLAKVGVLEVPALLKSETEDISSSVTEELADNELKLKKSGLNQVTMQTNISTTIA